MSVDLAVTASCGCFITSLSGGACVAMCEGHSARLLPVFDGRLDQLLADVDERYRQAVEDPVVAAALGEAPRLVDLEELRAAVRGRSA